MTGSLLYLALQSTYLTTHVALCLEGDVIDAIAIDNKQASKLIITTIDTLLHAHNLTLSDLAFISASQGPAPFTSLRTVITTLNGIALGHPMALVGVNGLELFVQEHRTGAPIIALLNAFCDDVYYGFTADATTITTGVMNIDSCITWLKTVHPSGDIVAVGNGVTLHQEKLRATFGEQLIISEPLPQIVSLSAVARAAFQQYQQQNTCTLLSPLYLKNYSAIMGQ